MKPKFAITTISAVGILVVLASAGCRRKAAPPPSSAPPVEAAPVATASPNPASGASAPAPVVTTTASNQAAYEQEMAQTLNDLLGEYIREKKRIPKDVAEMANLRLITSVPALPPGKKWVINQQTGKISAQ